MRRVDGMGIVCHAGLLALTVLLSAGCGQQKGAGGAGAPGAEMTAAVQEQGGAGTGTAGPAASSEQPSQETVPVPPQPAQADQLGQPPQTVQGEEPAVSRPAHLSGYSKGPRGLYPGGPVICGRWGRGHPPK